MKILLYTDVHWSETSSIVNSIGKKYTTRLENLIKSVSWAERQADLNNCDQIICLGDFFDRYNLTAQEVTALNEVQWSEKPHTFIVGNHESPHKSLEYNSVNTLRNLGFEIINKPCLREYDSFILSFIPYTLEEDRKPLKEYLGNTSKCKIVLSHNDIKGIQYGAFLSKEGFDKEEIDNECDLFLNGHLHNGEKFSKKGYNLGNLTGQNFSENAFVYMHGAFILDIDTLTLNTIENPFAFNFYKIEITKASKLTLLCNLKNNAVVSIKYDEKYLKSIREILDNSDTIIASRTTVVRDVNNNTNDVELELNASDYLTQFYNFALDTLGKDDIVLSELSEVMK